MKILMIFIDMVKGLDFLESKSNISQNKFNLFLNEFGGTIFTNIYTEGPDTPRSMSSFYSGKKPSENGCIDRLKWPEFYLKGDHTIFDYFIENNYKLDFFSNPTERSNGLFPKKIIKLKNSHNTTIDLKKFIDELTLAEDHLIFISLPDLHSTMDDIGYNILGEFYGYYNVVKSLNIIFNKFNKDVFDNTLIFSDHGYKHRLQQIFEKPLHLLNKDRTQTFLLVRNKYDCLLHYDNTLLAVSDIYCAYKNFSGINNILYTIKKTIRSSVLIEDHTKFTNQHNQVIGIWAIAKKDSYYIRNLKNGLLFDYDKNIVTISKSLKHDKELMNLKSFENFISETKLLKSYRANILKPSGYYTNGVKRIKLPKL